MTGLGAGTRVSFAADSDRATAIDAAARAFLRDGVVVLDDLVDPALLARCHAQLERDHADYVVVDLQRNFGNYKGRHTAPVLVDGAFAERAVFLPDPVIALARRLLGGAPEIDSFGVLVSLPGSNDQARHADALLYPDVGADVLVPPFAAAFAMPLVPMDARSGTTGFWLGSHRKPGGKGPHDFAPEVMPGSALLWDFRLVHHGLANRGTAPRPVLFTVFCRPWWHQVVDPCATRYEKLVISPRAFDALGAEGRRLAARAVVRGAPVDNPPSLEQPKELA
ncbi:MAG: hypothetical protein A4S12_01015 [Proteobacteria bacterium SG_bin5]|nr:MAG: hypothetical protein A4S12_01015 [Proteobacteria bacterium SG_bin5]